MALSAPGTIAGTAAYMSPEQATGGKVDARSDIFSFGAMLYEMVTGVRGVRGTSTADTLTAVVRAQPKRPSDVVPGVPHGSREGRSCAACGRIRSAGSSTWPT